MFKSTRFSMADFSTDPDFCSNACTPLTEKERSEISGNGLWVELESVDLPNGDVVDVRVEFDAEQPGVKRTVLVAFGLHRAGALALANALMNYVNQADVPEPSI